MAKPRYHVIAKCLDNSYKKFRNVADLQSLLIWIETKAIHKSDVMIMFCYDNKTRQLVGTYSKKKGYVPIEHSDKFYQH